jgi:hypothetical protein
MLLLEAVFLELLGTAQLPAPRTPPPPLQQRGGVLSHAAS